MNPAIRFLMYSVLIAGTCASAQPLKEGVPLFDGSSLGGWVVENDGQFSVEDGVLKINRGTGWLRSEKTYDDFVLHMEFRFLEEKANSGIFVRTGPTSKDDEKGYPDNGYQVQCMDTLEGKYPIATIIPYGASDVESSYDIEDLKKAYRPALEWQSYDIVCLGESIKIWLNGVPVVSGTSIKKLEGHIGLQGELGLLEFRSIELTEL